VAPIRGCGDELDSGFTGAMMLVIDPTHTDVVSTEGMQALYNLTEAESDICRLIAEGLGTDDIADAQNLTRETVRTYVKRTLEKTGMKNRVQLVRLALTVNLPIDES
jgi:DNA-binding CsgD family transcriptional regulator